jgi:xanthine dehydrogenase accessory factor
MDLAILTKLNAARAARTAAILVTDFGNGTTRLVIEGDDLPSDPLGETLGERFRSGRSGAVTLPDGASLFLTVHVPPPHFVLIGAVHVSQALAPMARIAGFDVTIVDPRTGFAGAGRFPDVRLFAEWPVDALPKVGLDPFTAMAALTHDPRIDDDAIAAALEAECFYVGALGSRRTHGRRLERLRERGFDDATLARIHGPIGIPIDAQSPAEIAVAILAQVIQALRTRGAVAKDEAA